MFILIHRKGRQERKDNSILASLNSENLPTRRVAGGRYRPQAL